MSKNRVLVRGPAGFALSVVLVLLSVSPLSAQDAQNRKRQQQARQQQGRAQQRDFTQLLGRYDKNKDGVLERSELPPQIARRMAQLDTDKDGKLTRAELQRASRRRNTGSNNRSRNRRPGEVITPAAKGERYQDKLKVGDAAPDFTLLDPTGQRAVTLSQFQGQRPVVLIFGSYT